MRDNVEVHIGILGALSELDKSSDLPVNADVKFTVGSRGCTHFSQYLHIGGCRKADARRQPQS